MYYILHTTYYIICNTYFILHTVCYIICTIQYVATVLPNIAILFVSFYVFSDVTNPWFYCDTNHTTISLTTLL